MTKGTSKPKVNKQLIRTIRQLYSSVPSSLHVTIRWTKAHVTKDVTAESYWNSQVDKLAALGAGLTPNGLTTRIPEPIASPVVDLLLPPVHPPVSPLQSLSVPPLLPSPCPTTPDPLPDPPLPQYDSDDDYSHRCAPVQTQPSSPAPAANSSVSSSNLPIIETPTYRIIQRVLPTSDTTSPTDFTITTSMPLFSPPPRKRPRAPDPQSNNNNKRINQPHLWPLDAQRPLFGSLNEPQYNQNSTRDSPRCSHNLRTRLTRRRSARSHRLNALVEPRDIITAQMKSKSAVESPSSSSHIINNNSNVINSVSQLPIPSYLHTNVNPILPDTAHPPSLSPSLTHSNLMEEPTHSKSIALSNLVNSSTPTSPAVMPCTPQAEPRTRTSKRPLAAASQDWTSSDPSDPLASSPMHIDDVLIPHPDNSVDSHFYSHSMSVTYSECPELPCKKQKPSSPVDTPHSTAINTIACPEAKRGPIVLDSS